MKAPKERDGSGRARLWRSLGLELPEGGSPKLTDHEAAVALIAAAAERLIRALPRPSSRRVLRWVTASGLRSRIVVNPSRSRREGWQPSAERNVRAYLLVEVLGLTVRELAPVLGLQKSAAAVAVANGRRSVVAFGDARTVSRTDPRRPGSGGRPDGKNESRW